jgi:hypothetical protein
MRTAWAAAAVRSVRRDGADDTLIPTSTRFEAGLIFLASDRLKKSLTKRTRSRRLDAIQNLLVLARFTPQWFGQTA